MGFFGWIKKKVLRDTKERITDSAIYKTRDAIKREISKNLNDFQEDIHEEMKRVLRDGKVISYAEIVETVLHDYIDRAAERIDRVI